MVDSSCPKNQPRKSLPVPAYPKARSRFCAPIAKVSVKAKMASNSTLLYIRRSMASAPSLKVIPFHNQRRIEEMEFLHRLTITQASLIGIINVVWSLQINDALPAQANQMLHHEIRINIIIHHQPAASSIRTECGRRRQSPYHLPPTADTFRCSCDSCRGSQSVIHHKLLHHLQVLQFRSASHRSRQSSPSGSSCRALPVFR